MEDLSIIKKLTSEPIKGYGEECLEFTQKDWIQISQQFTPETFKKYHPIYVLRAMSEWPEHDEDTAYGIIKSYFYQSVINQLDRLFVLEYLFWLGCTKWIKQLINEKIGAKDPNIQELKSVYTLYVAQVERKISGEDAINQAMELDCKHYETKMAAMIIHLYAISRLGLHEPFIKLLNAVIPSLSYCQHKELLTAFKIQLGEMYIFSTLYKRNDIEAFRELCGKYFRNKDLLKQFPLLEIHLTHMIAHSHTFYNFEKSKEWLFKSLILTECVHSQYRKISRTDIINSFDFLRSLWKKELHVPPASLSEKAHRLIVTGHTEEGLAILQKIKKKNGKFTLFEQYYVAMAQKNKDYADDIKQLFQHNRNEFYIQVLDNPAFHISS